MPRWLLTLCCAVLMVGLSSCGRTLEPEEQQGDTDRKEPDTEMSSEQEKELSPEAQQALLKIARRSVEAAVRGQVVPPAEADLEELKLHLGAFVTLTNRGELRGCIGEFEAKRPIAEVVRDMAIASSTQDHRFAANPVTAKELPQIEIEISALSPRRKMENPLDLELGKHGIYIRSRGRSGTFLPQVATEYNMSKEEFLSTCCTHKLGLPGEAWKDSETEVFVYTAQIFSEHGEHK